jgi:PIN domain nuclease of toxin-antitoxin system
MASVTYLDTHVVVWLYGGELARFRGVVRNALGRDDLRISPMVFLELTYLFETGRTTVPADVVVGELATRLGLQVCDALFPEVVSVAATLTWTRDPFDRIIVAQAARDARPLITKDRTIRDHYAHALWADE